MGNIFKEYIDYLKDNPNNFWFKRKPYGWGWIPATWQGWLILFVYTFIIVLFSLTIDENSSGRELIFTLILPIGLLTAVMVWISYKKGEKPRWQWSFNKKDNLPQNKF